MDPSNTAADNASALATTATGELLSVVTVVVPTVIGLLAAFWGIKLVMRKTTGNKASI